MSSGFSSTPNLFSSSPHLAFPINAQIPHHPFFPYGAAASLQQQQQQAAQRIKLKRTRQRVDAGEPRNTYSSIPTYSTSPPGRQITMAASASSPRFSMTPPSSRYPSSTADQMAKLFQQAGYPNTGSMPPQDPQAPVGTFGNFLPQMQTAWLRLQQQALSQGTAPNLDGQALKELLKQADPQQNVTEQKDLRDSASVENGNEGADCKVCDGNSPVEDGKAEENHNQAREADSASVTPSGGVSPVPCPEKKRRVENIINTIQSDPNSPSDDIKQEAESPRKSVDSVSVSPKSKRKQYQPQQVDTEGTVVHEQTSPSINDDNVSDIPNDTGDLNDDDQDEPDAKQLRISEPDGDPATQQNQMAKMQELWQMQRQWYVDWLAQQQKKIAENGSQTKDNNTPEVSPNSQRSPTKSVDSSKEIKNLATTLKTELVSALSTTIDKIVNNYLQAEAARLAAQQQLQINTEQHNAALAQQQQQNRQMYLNPFYAAGAGYPFGSVAGGMGFGVGSPATSTAAGSIFPGFNSSFGGATGLGTTGPTLTRDKDTFSLVMPRKKRSKVTDTRLSKMPIRGDESRSSPSSTGAYFPPTMVGHPLYPSFRSMDDRDVTSPSNSDEMSEMGPYDPSMPQSCTLTPMHLRKAKLMFFFTRYPSSTLLKTYFPDIRFNKNNTAQLVKWFSNFREFYYIQMEKYSRQALAEGIKRPDEISVTLESEIYKVLNQHYNRNNHIQVPPSFREVVEATLREFFVAVQANKDAEPSWKKQIYKVIARLDDAIPDFFKNPNFLEQLE